MPGISRYVRLELASPSLVFRSFICALTMDGQGFLGVTWLSMLRIWVHAMVNPFVMENSSIF
jgi:hypothetical protein